jgi:hypothetical protein
MRSRAVLYSTDSTHMVCVIVSSTAAIPSVAKSIREGYRYFKLWPQQARFSYIRPPVPLGEDIEVVEIWIVWTDTISICTAVSRRFFLGLVLRSYAVFSLEALCDSINNTKSVPSRVIV